MKLNEFVEYLEKKNFSLAAENGKLILKGDNKKLTKTELDDIKKDNFVINYIREHRDELMEFVSVSQDPRLEKKSKDITSIYKLSGLQTGMLFHGLYAGTGGAYTEQLRCDLIGANAEIITQSWNEILKRHSILRSAIFYDEFIVPVQCVYREAKLPVMTFDFRELTPEDQAAAVKSFEEEDREKGFDFNSVPLMRLALLRLGEDRYRMVWTSHHILFDGWSMSILMGEFLSIYETLLAGKEIEPAEEDLYEDYIRYLDRLDKEEQENYWRKYMKGLEHSTLLPFIGTTTERTKGKGSADSAELIIDKETTAKVEQYVQKNRLTTNTFIQGVWSYLLHNYTGSNDIAYGVIVSGRPDDLPGVEHRVGMYINTLPLHSTYKADLKVKDWLLEIQDHQFTSRQHQYTPLSEVQSWTGVRGDLFDTLLVFENYPVSDIIGSKKWSMSVDNVQMDEMTNYPLSIIVGSSDKISMQFNYNPGLLKPEYVKEICGHFENVLNQILEDEDITLEDIKLLTESEENKILAEFNETALDYPQDKSLTELFAEQVSKTPDRTALVFEDRELTYKELDELSNRMANHLKEKGIQPGENVGLLSYRNIEMITGMLGILKSGCAYVPFNTDYPAERINFITEDSGIKNIVYTDNELLKQKGLEKYRCIKVQDSVSSSSEPTGTKAGIDSCAYVMYTSGTTGHPKGISVSHRNVIKLVYDPGEISIEQDDRVMQWSNYSFDGSTYDIYCSLLKGAGLYLIKDSSASDADEMSHVMIDKKITVCFMTTALFNTFVDIQPDALKGLRKILFGGEKVSLSHVRKALSVLGENKIVHVYGPTETTVYATSYPVNNINEDGIIPIGRPLTNTKLYILSSSGKPVPEGITGELYIGGDGVSMGYVNNPELTEEKFIANPFDKTSDKKLYKTGDLCRWLPDGNIEYLSRTDDQVKIRGFRIELSEIENVLLQNESLSQAVVMARDSDDGTKQLTGYVVTAGKFEKEEIINYLRSKLPDYMIPALWVEMESMPLTPNGKIDKKALPAPDASEGTSNEYVAPRNETEEKLAAIWKELLKTEKIGVNDSFFELGGHSLLAMRLISSVRKEMKSEIAIKDIFLRPTIADLAIHIETQSKATLLPPIVINERPERIPLSFSQERLAFIDKLEGTVQYHIPIALRLKGKLNKENLGKALRQIANRHEILRTVILEEDGVGYQVVREANNDEWNLNYSDGSVYKDDVEALQIYIQELINLPFDLSEDHMIRTHLIKINEDEHILVLNMHHIASDGWSLSIVISELVEMYEALTENREAKLSDLPIQYADFALWQRDYLKGEVLEKKLDYWKTKLKGTEPLQLPADFPRPAKLSINGASKEFNLDKDLSDSVHKLCQQSGTTMFMTLLAAFNVLLYRYSGQNDICVGSPIAGRQQKETEDLIGFFVNTLALRSDVSGELSFSKFLQQVKTTTLEAYENQEVPFEKIVESVESQRDMSRNPLFQVMFALQNVPDIPQLGIKELSLFKEEFISNVTKFDISFFMTETPVGLYGTVEYCTDLFSEETIDRMIGHFNQLLGSIVKAPQQMIGSLPMLSKAEEHKLLVEFNDTAVEFPKDKIDKGISGLIEEQAEINPDNVALVLNDNKLTYKELNERSNRLGHYLRSKGVKGGTLVPICMERSMEMITGIISILKAGGAYVPVDPDYPAERISYMLEDTGAKVMLTSKNVKSRLPEVKGIAVIDTDSEIQEISKQSAENLKDKAEPGNIAYVLYTSGSTGKPKGVRMPESSLMNLLLWQDTQFENKQRKVLQFTSLNFDVSFQEIFSTLCFGSTLCLISAERRIDMSEVLKDIAGYNITHLFIPYIVLKNLAELFSSLTDVKHSLEEIITAGEQLVITKEIEEVLNKGNIKLYNHYGPTEAHVVSSYKIDSTKDIPLLPPIGKPIANTKLYIVRDKDQPVPVGASGELYIGGVQVAQGYQNLPDLTAEKFIKDPFENKEGARVYKTGDLVRWLPDGNIDYLGRIDDQIKIRGYRVEPGEIENMIQQSGMVSGSVVIAKADKTGNKRLTGYVVAGENFDKEEMINYLRGKLPDYMVPAFWVKLESIPLTPTGKTDKKALPDPDITEELKDKYVGPRNETEEKLAEIYKELLLLERVGVHDNFFELGGHSLLATRAVSAIKKKLSVNIPIKALFEFTNIAELSKYILLIKSNSKKNIEKSETFEL